MFRSRRDLNPGPLGYEVRILTALPIDNHIITVIARVIFIGPKFLKGRLHSNK